MMVSKDRPMTRDPSGKGKVGAIGWPLAILTGGAMLLGGLLGYNKGIVESGGEPVPIWAGALAAAAFCLVGFAVYLRAYRAVWERWSPRKRRYWLSLGLCALAGAIIGGWFSAQRPLDQSLIEAATSMSFTPGFAIGVSLLWLVSLSIGSFFYHISIDDHEERAWLWAGLAGWYAVAFTAPVWWALHRAGLAPPADAMLLFLLSLIVNGVVYIWLKFR